MISVAILKEKCKYPPALHHRIFSKCSFPKGRKKY